MIPLTVCFIAVYFLMLVLLSRVKTRIVPGRVIYLLRAFFPSWKFFEDAGDVPQLWTRESEGDDWQLCIELVDRKWSAFFLNPVGNSLLAYGSLLQQLMSELEEIESPLQLEKNISYQLTKNLARHQFLKKKPLGDAVSYQFKVSTFDSRSSEILMDEILVSPVYPL